jgi:hypothetical protein
MRKTDPKSRDVSKTKEREARDDELGLVSGGESEGGGVGSAVGVKPHIFGSLFSS